MGRRKTKESPRKVGLKDFLLYIQGAGQKDGGGRIRGNSKWQRKGEQEGRGKTIGDASH